MNKKISLGAAVAFMVVIAGITFCITMMVSLKLFNTMVLNVKNREEMYKKIADIDREARQNYDGVIDEDFLLDYVSRGYVRGLGDKYSSYMSKIEYEQYLKELSGTQFGIGVDFVKDETGYIRLKTVEPKAAAGIAGLLEGDYIISINDTDLMLVSSDAISRSLQGEIGTKVKVVYRRDGVDTSADLIRNDVQLPVVELTMVETNAHIKISAFNSYTSNQFKTKVEEAIRLGATGLVFDVRGNVGTNLDAATEMLNMLLPSGDLAYKTSVRDGKTLLLRSDRYEIALPMVCITNGKTASAAELFAATLRDFGKSGTVGVNTAGIAAMRTLIQLTDGSAINLTTSYFLPASGEAIEGVGVSPTYLVKLTAEQEANFEFMSIDQDPQVAKAIEVLNSGKVN